MPRLKPMYDVCLHSKYEERTGKQFLFFWVRIKDTNQKIMVGDTLGTLVFGPIEKELCTLKTRLDLEGEAKEFYRGRKSVPRLLRKLKGIDPNIRFRMYRE